MFPTVRNQKLIIGSFFTPSQYNSSKKVVILGKAVYDKLFGEANPLGRRVTVSDQQYQVLGVFEEKGAFGGQNLDGQVFIPTTTAMRQYDMQYIHTIWIQSLDSKTIPQTKLEVEKIILKTLKKDDFSIIDTKSILNVASQILRVLTIALGGIAAISLVVGGIGIMNIMLVSVTERTKEIGLRKAIGATPKAILIQFLIESIILSVFGGLVGVILGSSISFAIGRFFTTTISPSIILLAFGVSACIGIVFGVLPAARASKLNPIDALRYE